MSSDLNRALLIGRFTRDPELRYTQNGTSVCSFSIANNRTYVTGGEKKDQVSYFNCVAWGKMGEVIAEFFKKGNRIGIEGRLQQRSWEDQEHNKKQIVEVVVDNFQFLTPKGEGVTSTPAPSGPENGEPADTQADLPYCSDDISF